MALSRQLYRETVPLMFVNTSYLYSVHTPFKIQYIFGGLKRYWYDSRLRKLLYEDSNIYKRLKIYLYFYSRVHKLKMLKYIRSLFLI
jgi:hypothetical protein